MLNRLSHPGTLGDIFLILFVNISLKNKYFDGLFKIWLDEVSLILKGASQNFGGLDFSSFSQRTKYLLSLLLLAKFGEKANKCENNFILLFREYKVHQGDWPCVYKFLW